MTKDEFKTHKYDQAMNSDLGLLGVPGVNKQEENEDYMFKVSPKGSPRGPAFGERKTSRSELQVDALENELIKQTSNSKPGRVQPR